MEDQFDEPRRSLLDVVTEKLQKQGKTVLISRMVYIGLVDQKNSSHADIMARHEELLKQSRKDGEAEHTGLLLCYPSCFVHMLECQTESILELLRLLCKLAPSERFFREIRIISSTEDIPSRAYPKWATSFHKAEEKPTPIEEEALVDSASDVNLGLIKLGKQLSAMSEQDMNSAISNIAGAYLDCPNVGKLQTLGAHNGVPSAEEFLDIFDTPVDIDLDSENVWPMPVPITYTEFASQL